MARFLPEHSAGAKWAYSSRRMGPTASSLPTAGKLPGRREELSIRSTPQPPTTGPSTPMADRSLEPLVAGLAIDSTARAATLIATGGIGSGEGEGGGIL